MIHTKYTVELTEKEYDIIRGLLEKGYYSAKDEGDHEEMEDITELESKFINLLKKR